MSVKIRLSRGGAKKRPYYRIVIADARSPRDGRFIERVGSYNPMVPKDHPDRIVLNEERLKHWLGEGAQPTGRVQKFLANAGMMEAAVLRDQTKQHLPKQKAKERMEEKAKKAKDAEEAAAAAAAEAEEAAKAAAAAPAEEAPAEEAPAEEVVAEEAAAEEEKS